jgi:chaperonin GroEL (HSP60 family)
MSAQLATVGDRILAHVEDAAVIRDGSLIPSITGDRPQIGGMQFDCGYLSPHFITDPERMEVSFDNVYVLAHEGTISSRKDLLSLLEQITKSGRPMLIIAEDITGEALAALVVKNLSGRLRVAAVRAPNLGDQRKSMLHDISFFTGGKTTTEGLKIQLSDMQISDLGQARRITVDKSHTCIITLESRHPLQRTPSLPAAAGVSPEFDSSIKHIQRPTSEPSLLERAHPD